MPLLRSLGATALLLAAGSPCVFGQAPPQTDIAIVGIADGTITGPVERATDRPAYDNQPSFLSNDELLYTALSDDGTTNIVSYSLASQERRVVIDVDESVYSATPIPGTNGGAISVIRDYGDLVQQLWSFPVHTGDPKLLLENVNPIGYHAWSGRERLLLFVLGDPPTLQLAEPGPKPGRVIATNPGRAIARRPLAAGGELSFVHKTETEGWWLCLLDEKGTSFERFVEMPEGVEDYAWAPDGSVWFASGEGLGTYSRSGGRTTSSSGGPLMLDGARLKGITRLAFSPDGSKLAVVFERP